MATYKNNGGDLVFPTLMDADGNVLVVAAGETFTAPDGLIVDGVSPVTKSSKATASDAPVENATEPTVAVETETEVTDADATDAVDPSTTNEEQA